jgi:hypothetical protein
MQLDYILLCVCKIVSNLRVIGLMSLYLSDKLADFCLENTLSFGMLAFLMIIIPLQFV